MNQAPVLTTAGYGMATTDFGPLSAQARSVVVQADGKIVVNGYTQDAQHGGNYISELVRYNADGSIDTTFGIGGIVSSGPGFTTGSDVAIQADGKIVTAGAVFGSPNHFTLARYNSDGSFDTSFGTGGKIVTDFGNTVPFGLLIQPDGKIVLTGGAPHAGGGSDFAVARFNTDGSFDTSFGTGGKVTTDFGGTYAAGYGIARTPDGKIVVAGIKEFVGVGFDYDFAVARYNDDGNLDTSFGAGGKVTTDFASTDDIPYTVTVQADGKIVVAGITDPGNASNFGLVRYNLDGSLDTSFGTGGKVATDFGGNFEAGNGVTMQADGKIVVAGFSMSGSPFNADFALARYNSDGSLDTSFGTGGKVKTNFGSNNESAISVVMQPDGKIVVTGSTNDGVAGTGADYATVRYNSDGSLDTSFGIVAPLGGAAFFTEGGAQVVLNARANVHDADLDAAGSYAGASLTLARHGGADAQDVFGASGNLAALTEGGNIVLSGVVIGTVTQNSGGTLLLTFGANATEARVNEAMRDITYANSSDDPAASVQVDWSFSDGNTGAQGSGGALAAIGSTVVNIAAVNDAPVNVIAAQTATEDTSAAITGLSVNDPDIGSGHITVTLTVQHGTIFVRDDIAGGLDSSDITGNGTASVTLSCDPALVNATLASGVSYRTSANFNGIDTLTMLSNDGGNTGSGGSKTDSDTVNIVVASVNDAPSISAIKTASGAIVRVSTNAAGVQGNVGNSISSSPVFSPDGTKIAFYSDASNLVPGDTNGNGDIFVKDLVTGAIARVSTSATGAQSDGYSLNPKFSPDGSKIAFSSVAANLVPGDNNGVSDVFVKDLASGAITRIGGTTAGDPSYWPVFSPDGSKIAFYSYASNLVANDLNNTGDVFIKDLTTGAITRVSTNAAGVGGNSASLEPVFSPDGSKVAFFSFASNLVAGGNSVGSIFVKDIASGQVTLASATADGTQGNNISSEPVFSPDGTKVAFYSIASNLVPGDSNGFSDAFVKDLVTGGVTRVSTDAAGVQGNRDTFFPLFSPDGNKIVFFSNATNFVAGDSNGTTDVFVKDLVTGAIIRVSTDAAGAQSNEGNAFSVFSPDGSKVAFYSFASNLVPGDSNNAFDVFVKSLVSTPEDPAAYTENALAVHVATAAVTVTDVDNATFGGGSLTAALTAGSHAGDGLTLIASTTPGTGIEVSGSTVKFNGAAIGTISGNGTASLAVALNGSATAAAVQALAGAVGFASAADDPVADARTVTFTLVDGSGTANGGHDTGSFTQTVLVTAVNDAPVNTVPGAFITAPDVDHAITGLSLSDPDSASLSTILSVDHGTLTVGAIGGATVAGSGTGSVTLTGSAAQIDAALAAAHNVLYHSVAGFHGTDVLTMSSSDGSSGHDVDTVAITNLTFAQAVFELSGFGPGAGGWTSNDTYPRELADVNGDHMADIVAFGQTGVFVSLATGGGAFGAPTFQLAGFGPGSGGWTSNETYPRELADVNGDHMADIVAFGNTGVFVSLAAGGGSFGTPTFQFAGFGPGAGGWTSNDQFPRELADVNGDHMADIVAFGQTGVFVSLATGGGTFAAPTFQLAGFSPNTGGWTSQDQFPRELADVNNDGMADIVAFGNDGVFVSLATGGGGLATPTFQLAAFGPNSGGWISNDQFPRELADANGDGNVDIVGFGQTGVYVALGNGDGSFQPAFADLRAFGPETGGWTSQDTTPRLLADVDHDGAADIIGFGQSGVYEALSNGFHLI